MSSSSKRTNTPTLRRLSQVHHVTIKTENESRSSVACELVASVAQSLDQYEARTLLRRHKKDIAEVTSRNPVFHNIPTTCVPPILQDLSISGNGVQLYLSPSSNLTDLQVRVPIEMSVKMHDHNLGRYTVFGTEDIRRAMAIGILKFLLWQCGDIGNFSEVALDSVELDWLHFPQRIWERGYNLINLPPKALYPNGQHCTHPLLLPIEVIDEIIIQFAHEDSSKRLGVINAAHENNQTSPFMSRVPKPNESKPFEWSVVGMNPSNRRTLIQVDRGGPCRCNDCIDILFGDSPRLGLQLVRNLEASDASSPVTDWIANWTESRSIFVLTKELTQTGAGKSLFGNKLSGSIAASDETRAQEDTETTRRQDHAGTSIDQDSPSSFSLKLVVPGKADWELSEDSTAMRFCDIVFDEDAQADQSDYIESEVEDQTSVISSVASPLHPSEREQSPESIDYDTVQSIVSEELEWDLEDIKTDVQRWEHDEKVKREREEEDRKQETDRKRRRVMLGNEAQIAKIVEQRADEDRQKQEERQRQDEVIRQRFQAKLAEVE